MGLCHINAPSDINSHAHTHKMILAFNQAERNGIKVLTDTNWELSGPFVVLLANPY